MSYETAPTADMRSGIVVICDVNLDDHDATRVHTLEIASGFADAGSQVTLIARGNCPQLPNVHYTRARGPERRSPRRIIDVNLRSLFILATRRRRANRCYVRARWSSLPAVVSAYLLGYRVVLQMDDVEFSAPELRNSSRGVQLTKVATVRIMTRLAGGIVAVTPRIKSLLVTELGVPASRVTVLANGANVDQFVPQPREQAIAKCGLDPALRYLAFCGRFQPWVDFDLIVDAVALVVREQPDVRLILIGEGSQRDSIVGRARMREIEPFLLFTGLVSDRTRVRDLIGASTVALSAHVEDHGSPVKIAEYMACGRAVVCTDQAGMRESVECSGAGLVVPRDPEKLADAILRLLDPEVADAMGAAGRELAKRQYSWRAIAQATLQIFEAP